MAYSLDKNYDPLERREKWDLVTQEVVETRIKTETAGGAVYNFFSPEEAVLLEKVVDALLPQDEGSPRVKIAEAIDKDLAEDFKGVRYGNNPWPREFYKKGLLELKDLNFGILGDKEVFDFIAGVMLRRSDDFLKSFLKRVLSDAVKIYYSHPGAWQKVGFPGPAYPEGYGFLGCGEAEEWEPKFEQQHEK